MDTALRNHVVVCGVATILFLLVSPTESHPQQSLKVQGPTRTATNDHYAPFLINHIFNYYGNNGDGSFNRFSQSNAGFEFPKGGGRHTMYEDGLLWGGYHKGRSIPKVGGSCYHHALQAGRILSPGTATTDPVADDPSQPEYRIYRVRPAVNPATPFDAAMEATLNQEEVPLISRYTSSSARGVYDQYIRDWNEWPAAEGAPFLDRNGNGIYDPSIDIPGFAGADQTLWYVANDCDPSRTNNFAGCPPIGLEVQRTIWGYNRGDLLANTIFIATRIINKSGAAIDSMYITQWSDPDIGDANDDLVGCDTVRNLGYAYNGKANDYTYGAQPPAVGFVMLQGPMVAGGSGDTALSRGIRRSGYRNLAVTSFIAFLSGTYYRDPQLGPWGDIEWYRVMKGTNACCSSPFVDPATGGVTRFMFSGDPVAGQGWVDGFPFSPWDRRCAFSSGPFSMANGDTQEVVVAHVVAQGPDRLSSVSLLKHYVDGLHAFIRDPARPLPPLVSAPVTYPSSSEFSLHVTADCRPDRPINTTALLKARDGSTIIQLPLLDDGLHGDGPAGDGVFASRVTLPRQPSPISLSMIVTDQSGLVHQWDPVQEGIITAGRVFIDEPMLFSDNFNNDGIANPGENIRYGFTIRSLSFFPLAQFQVASGDTKIQIPLIPAGGSDTMRYEPGNPQSYCTMTLPSSFKQGELVIPVILSDANGNFWSEIVSFPVVPLPYKPVGYSLVQNGGEAAGNFDLLVIDPARVNNHRYIIRGVDSIDSKSSPGFTLKDSTDGRILLLNHPLPDSLGHNIPVTDGFKILRGTIQLRTGTMKSWQVIQGTRPWTWTGVSNVLGLEGLGGTMGNAFDHWPSGGVGYQRQHSVRIVFSSLEGAGNLTDTSISYAYRYLENASAPPARLEFLPFIKNRSGLFAYQDYTRSLPFAAYDVAVDPPRRLMVGYLENNVPLGLVDGKYEPPMDVDVSRDNGIASGPREWFFIFDTPYSETPAPALQVDISVARVPLMWLGYPARRYPFQPGMELRIDTYHAPGPADWWTFVLNRNDYIPASYELFQNYPNPFNAGTTIRYTVPDPSNVTLKIYNLLGQEVRTLLSAYQYPGVVNTPWDGTNNAGQVVASGVYFYRFEATSVQDPGKQFVQVNKMMLVR